MLKLYDALLTHIMNDLLKMLFLAPEWCNRKVFAPSWIWILAMSQQSVARSQESKDYFLGGRDGITLPCQSEWH